VYGDGDTRVDASHYRGLDPQVITIPEVQMLDEGTYTAVVRTKDGNLLRSVPWSLTVNALPLISRHPTVYPKFPGDRATLSAGGFFSPETKFTWYQRREGETSWLPLPSGPVPTDLVIGNVQIADEGWYQMEAANNVGVALSVPAFLQVERPAFITLSVNGVSGGTVGVFPDSPLDFDALVTGSLVGSAGLTYQKLQPGNKWGNLNVSGGPLDTRYSLPRVSEEHEGYYRVMAVGKVNGVLYSNTVKLDVYDDIAFTSNKPASVVATEGEVFTIAAPVTGYAPSYQWRHNGEDISTSSGTLATFTTVASTSAAGTYSVRVTNGKPGNIPKEMVVAFVSVNARPNIVMGHAELPVDEGRQITVSGTISGTPGEVRYQWRKDGKPLGGPNASGVVYLAAQGSVLVQYTSDKTVPDDEGFYDLVATNAFGSTAGSLVWVDVFTKPRFLDSPNVQDVVVLSGESVVFRVNGLGSGNLSYQWYGKGPADANFSRLGEPSAESFLTVSGSASLSDDGSQYRVELSSISTATGSLLVSGSSQIATLRVAAKAALKLGPLKLNNNDSGVLSLKGANTLVCVGSLGKAVASASSVLAYRWQRNGEQILGGTLSVPQGATEFSVSYNLPASLNNNSDGAYQLIVDSGADVAVSPSMDLVLDPKILSVDIPRTINPSDPVKFSAVVSGAKSSYRYAWYRDGAPVNSGTLSGSPPHRVEYAIPASENTGTRLAGVYQLRVGPSVTEYLESTPVLVSVAKAAAITLQPAVPSRVGESGAFTLRVGASGDNLRYQWSRDGVMLDGATAQTLTRTGKGNLDGAYQVKVWNEFSAVLSKVVNVVVSADLRARILDPEPVDIGRSANLIADAAGPGQLSYQWYRGGSKITGATSETLRLSPVRSADRADYRVEVTARDGAVILASTLSSAVSLAVRDVPRILVSPLSRIVKAGTLSVAFTVVAESREGRPLTYTWSGPTGVPLNVSGSLNASTVKISGTNGVGLDAAGVYSVTVSSGNSVDSGSVTVSARLTVLNAGTVEMNPVTAGSDGVSVHTSWWVYWVRATNKESGAVRNGYYALQRELNGKVVTPKQAVWVWEPVSADITLQDSSPDDVWSNDQGDEQFVIDAAASDSGEFSVLASRHGNGGDYQALGYAISGRLEEEGDGSLYGAPDFVEGSYTTGSGEFIVELNWDMEQVYQMDVLNADGTALQSDAVRKGLRKALETISINID
jgi:hypothetical protein